jgi:hypothetical protein
LPKRRGQFRGEKRRKELVRLQKQEEKRKRRFGIQTEQEPATPATDAEKQEEGEFPTPETPDVTTGNI